MKSWLLVTGLGAALVGCSADTDVAVDETEDLGLSESKVMTRQSTSGVFTGTWAQPGFHRYPGKAVQFRAAEGCKFRGGTINLKVRGSAGSPAVPNRLWVINYQGNIVGDTGWRGKADYAGPWGASLDSGAQNVWSIDVTWGVTHILIVETFVGPNGPADDWRIEWSSRSNQCVEVPPPPPEPEPEPVPIKPPRG